MQGWYLHRIHLKRVIPAPDFYLILLEVSGCFFLPLYSIRICLRVKFYRVLRWRVDTVLGNRRCRQGILEKRRAS